MGKTTANNAVFAWSNASSNENRAKPDGDGAGAQRNTPTGSWFTQPDRAFQLIGEVDATRTPIVAPPWSESAKQGFIAIAWAP